MTLVQKQPYKKLQFTELFSVPDTPCTWAVSPTEKLSHKGTFTVDLHQNSYAFKDEAVLTVWSRSYPNAAVPRADNGGFFRLEIPIPLREFYDLMMEVLPEIYARLQSEV